MVKVRIASFMATAEERQWLEIEAKTRGESMTQVIRALIKKEMKKAKK